MLPAHDSVIQSYRVQVNYSTVILPLPIFFCLNQVNPIVVYVISANPKLINTLLQFVVVRRKGFIFVPIVRAAEARDTQARV